MKFYKLQEFMFDLFIMFSCVILVLIILGVFHGKPAYFHYIEAFVKIYIGIFLMINSIMRNKKLFVIVGIGWYADYIPYQIFTLLNAGNVCDVLVILSKNDVSDELMNAINIIRNHWDILKRDDIRIRIKDCYRFFIF